MGAIIIDGKSIAAEIRREVATEAEELKRQGIVPGLAVVLVGSYAPSHTYVRMKEKAAREVGIESRTIRLGEDTSQEELHAVIRDLNRDPSVDAILVQLPLPRHLNEKEALELVDPMKDADCLHPCNVGRLLIGEAGIQPCTPRGCMALLDKMGIPIAGKKAVVIGRSNIVGKPMAVLLLHRHATVTVCHSRTPDLAKELREADIVVVAAGQPGLVRGGMLRPGCAVIDVGINRLPDGRLIGDVDFDSAAEVAGWITPVPGGVGPMTIAMLLRNTLEMARRRAGL